MKVHGKPYTIVGGLETSFLIEWWVVAWPSYTYRSCTQLMHWYLNTYKKPSSIPNKYAQAAHELAKLQYKLRGYMDGMAWHYVSVPVSETQNMSQARTAAQVTRDSSGRVGLRP